MQIGAASMESNMETPQKIKNGSAFWPNDPTSRNLFEGTQNTNLKEHKCPYVHCSIIYNRQDMEVAQLSIRWVDKTLWDRYIMEYYKTIKKKKVLPFATVWMDLENIIQSEISQLAYDFTHYVESNEQTELISKIETDS